MKATNISKLRTESCLFLTTILFPILVPLSSLCMTLACDPTLFLLPVFVLHCPFWFDPACSWTPLTAPPSYPYTFGSRALSLVLPQ